MDTEPLRVAYDRLLAAADEVAAGGGGTPRAGEWDAPQLLAHLLSVDAAITASACSVVAGSPAALDNRVCLEPTNLARIVAMAGSEPALRRRVHAQGRVLCALAGQLDEAELATPVRTVLVDGTTLQVDRPVPLGDLLRGLADDHLPRHTTQLRALLA